MKASADDARRLQGIHDMRIKTLRLAAPFFVSLVTIPHLDLVGQGR